jgi:hypothetical protein
MKRKGRKHLPKVGTASEQGYVMRHEREAVEENLGIRPGSPLAWVLGAVIVVTAIVAIVAFVALR